MVAKNTINQGVNDEDQGIAYDDIKTGEDIYYRLAVSFRRDNEESSVEIIDFSRK